MGCAALAKAARPRPMPTAFIASRRETSPKTGRETIFLEVSLFSLMVFSLGGGGMWRAVARIRGVVAGFRCVPQKAVVRFERRLHVRKLRRVRVVAIHAGVAGARAARQIPVAAHAAVRAVVIGFLLIRVAL